MRIHSGFISTLMLAAIATTRWASPSCCKLSRVAGQAQARSFSWPSPTQVATRKNHAQRGGAVGVEAVGIRATSARLLARAPSWQATQSRSLILTAVRQHPVGGAQPPPPSRPPSSSLKEDIYTIPNLLTIARIASTPVLGYMILQGDFVSATALLFFAGTTDLLDGWLARRMNTHTVFGSIADPAADKILMTTMVVCLAMKGLMPVPLAVLILGRDVLLILWAFIIRYRSLPPPRTFSRYWDFSLPSASVQPTTISKYNTFLQLVLVGASTVLPACPATLQAALQGVPMSALQGIVAATTAWSGASYFFGSSGFSVVGGKAGEEGAAAKAIKMAATAATAQVVSATDKEQEQRNPSKRL